MSRLDLFYPSRPRLLQVLLIGGFVLAAGSSVTCFAMDGAAHADLCRQASQISLQANRNANDSISHDHAPIANADRAQGLGTAHGGGGRIGLTEKLRVICNPLKPRPLPTGPFVAKIENDLGQPIVVRIVRGSDIRNLRIAAGRTILLRLGNGYYHVFYYAAADRSRQVNYGGDMLIAGTPAELLIPNGQAN